MLQWTKGYLCSFELVFQVSSDKFPEVGHKAVPFLIFELSPYCFHSGCINQHSHQQCTRLPLSPHPRQPSFVVDLLMVAILTSVRQYLFHCGFNLDSLMISDIEHGFSYGYWPSICPFLEKCLFRSFAHFLNWIVWVFGVEFYKFFRKFGY